MRERNSLAEPEHDTEADWQSYNSALHKREFGRAYQPGGRPKELTMLLAITKDAAKELIQGRFSAETKRVRYFLPEQMSEQP